jgi:hypothetical protein
MEGLLSLLSLLIPSLPLSFLLFPLTSPLSSPSSLFSLLLSSLLFSPSPPSLLQELAVLYFQF